jgi:flotillin
MALLEKANQEVMTVQQVSDAERQKRVAIVASEKLAEQEKLAADVAAYKKRQEADAAAAAERAEAEGRAQAARAEAQGAADAVRIKAQADAEAAKLQADTITKLAEANREAGMKEAEVLKQKIDAANAKSKEILLQEVVLSIIQSAPAIVRELVKPAEHIGEIKVLQLGGAGGAMGTNGAGGAGVQHPLLGNTVGPVAKTILEASAVMPLVQSMLKFADVDALRSTVSSLTPPSSAAGLATALQSAASDGVSVAAKSEKKPEARRDG